MVKKKDEEKTIVSALVRGMHSQRLEQEVREIVGKLDNKESRRRVLSHLQKLSVFMEEVQRLPPLEVLIYWEGSFAVFNYLRKCGQLKEKGVGFNPVVRDDIVNIILKITDENAGR